MGSQKNTEWIPGLPEELGLECLTRLPYTSHRVASWVCKKWHDLMESPEFYHQRQKLGFTHKIACLIQALPSPAQPDGSKLGDPLSYGVTVFDSVSRTWERLDPVPCYPDGLPLFCQLAGCDCELVVMGGWDPLSYEPVTDVFIYQFKSKSWRRGAPMPSKRSFFGIASVGGKVYVAGGHDENKNALRSAWAYDVKSDEWTELAQMSQERDECEGVVVGDEFWVVSGYGTESQGAFQASAEAYHVRTGEWRHIDDAWDRTRCPRACVGVGSDGKLLSWGDLSSAVRVGACGVMMGNRTLVIGSEYQGAPQGFYVMEGQNGKFEKINVLDEFSGYVQSGSCVEV